jgi:hypothetical protein
MPPVHSKLHQPETRFEEEEEEDGDPSRTACHRLLCMAMRFYALVSSPTFHSLVLYLNVRDWPVLVSALRAMLLDGGDSVWQKATRRIPFRATAERQTTSPSIREVLLCLLHWTLFECEDVSQIEVCKQHDPCPMNSPYVGVHTVYMIVACLTHHLPDPRRLDTPVPYDNWREGVTEAIHKIEASFKGGGGGRRGWKSL